MGKPFKAELEKVIDTYNWGMQQDVMEFRMEILHNSRLPLFIVGSGGSLSACYFAASLYQQFGIMAKAITPLELVYSKDALRKANILFVSASGKNTDILFSYKTAINYEPNRVYNLCMSIGSPLSKLSINNSITKTFEFNIPAGKDGFLATNSLVGFFSILHKTFSSKDCSATIHIGDAFFAALESFMTKVNSNFTFTILHAGWGTPVAIDIESKLAEAALADVLISDYRNFGHGRHHWFDKRVENAAIIALVSPEEKKLASKTLALLPANIPILVIDTEIEDTSASIELLIKSFHFINQLGVMQSIDPGRPGVPEFGSKLYHLNYQKFYTKATSSISPEIEIAITRKADTCSYNALTEKEKKYWLDGYNAFIRKITSVEFGAIVFDYDGTLCSSANRRNGVDHNTATHVIKCLERGIVVGIATGRGQSVRVDLQKVIPSEYWSDIIIGYYNCSDFGTLQDNHLPDKDLPQNPLLQQVYDAIKSHKFVSEILPELRPNQVTIEINEKSEWSKVRSSIIQFIISLNIANIQILESSHSMDIIDQTQTNKLNIIDHCIRKVKERNLSPYCLCIGDKGKWPGNDYQLLSTNYSLSVDEVSPLSDSCWNLSPSGVKNVDATIRYLSSLKYGKNGLVFTV